MLQAFSALHRALPGPQPSNPLLRAAEALCTSAAARSFSSSSTSQRGAAPVVQGPAASPASASSTARVPVERLQAAITPQVCEQLRRRGFAVVDNVLGQPTAAALRAEIKALRLAGALHKNHTHLVQGGSTGLLEKEHVWEAELMMPETQALAPLAAQLQNDGTLRVMLSVLMPEMSLQSQAIKLQWNAGHGGCFPMHFDTDSSLDTRRVTSIWYLNPAWQPGDGGELRLYPFPQAPVDVEPRNDRMVLFSSPNMLHRVLPSRQERFCFTIWLSEGPQHGGRAAGAGPGGGASSASPLVEQQRAELRRALSRERPLAPHEAWALALHPELRKHAAKWVHRAEWEASIRESHPSGRALDQALATFHRELAVVGRALGPLLPALEGGPPAAGLGLPAWF